MPRHVGERRRCYRPATWPALVAPGTVAKGLAQALAALAAPACPMSEADAMAERERLRRDASTSAQRELRLAVEGGQGT